VAIHLENASILKQCPEKSDSTITIPSSNPTKKKIPASMLLCFQAHVDPPITPKSKIDHAVMKMRSVSDDLGSIIGSNIRGGDGVP